MNGGERLGPAEGRDAVHRVPDLGYDFWDAVERVPTRLN
jgi:hypothetical protein